jgi:hypothetical protein
MGVSWFSASSSPTHARDDEGNPGRMLSENAEMNNLANLTQRGAGEVGRSIFTLPVNKDNPTQSLAEGLQSVEIMGSDLRQFKRISICVVPQEG